MRAAGRASAIVLSLGLLLSGGLASRAEPVARKRVDAEALRASRQAASAVFAAQRASRVDAEVQELREEVVGLRAELSRLIEKEAESRGASGGPGSAAPDAAAAVRAKLERVRGASASLQARGRSRRGSEDRLAVSAAAKAEALAAELDETLALPNAEERVRRLRALQQRLASRGRLDATERSDAPVQPTFSTLPMVDPATETGR